MIDEEIDWGAVPEEMSRQILAQATQYLDAQFSAALALDQRAMTSASIFIGFSAAIIGFATGNAAQSDGGLLWPSLIAGGFFLVAAVSAIWAARPVDFYYPGSHPKMWWPVRNSPLAEAMGGESENLQLAIDDNDNVLRRNRVALQLSMGLAGLAPIGAAIAWIYP